MKEFFHRLVVQVQRHAYLLVYGTYPPGTLVKYFYSGTLIEQVQQSIDSAAFPRENDICMIIPWKSRERSDPIAVICNGKIFLVKIENLEAL